MISPTSKDMMMIVSEFGKFRYNHLLVGMCSLGDISQSKLDEIIGYTKGIKTQIDDILVLGKESLSKHLYKLSVIFDRLSAAGLKLNETKCSFGLKDNTQLGYVITRYGTKPYPKKVQGFMYLFRTTTITELRALIGMVQYYMNMWPRWYHALALLIEVAISPKGRKILWNYALEESFKELNHMVSAETLLNYPDWTIPFIVHTNASDKQLVGVTSQDNKPIDFYQYN